MTDRGPLGRWKSGAVAPHGVCEEEGGEVSCPIAKPRFAVSKRGAEALGSRD